MLKCKNTFQIFQKYTEAIIEITEMLIAVLKRKFIVLFVAIFGTLSFPSSYLSIRDSIAVVISV